MNLNLLNLLIDKSKKSSASELANAQLFICKLCEALDLPPPEFATENDRENQYVFEKIVHFGALNGRPRSGRIDLYKRGCFVLESKQSTLSRRQGRPEGVANADDRTAQQEECAANDADRATLASASRQASGGRSHLPQPQCGRQARPVQGAHAWRRAMIAARVQAEHYARALPESPPFIIILDVGHVIELYADFSGKGRNYAPFPDPARHRIAMDELREPVIQQRLLAIWNAPFSLAHELQAPSCHGEDAFADYMLERFSSRRVSAARWSVGMIKALDLGGSRFAPCLGLRERGKAHRMLV